MHTQTTTIEDLRQKIAKLKTITPAQARRYPPAVIEQSVALVLDKAASVYPVHRPRS